MGTDDSPDQDQASGAVDGAFRAGITGKRFIDTLGLENVVVLTDTDGPNERFMIGIERLDGLEDARSAYSTGRALLIIGACLDGLWSGLRFDDIPAKQFVRDLKNEIRKHNTIAPHGAWSGGDTVKYFGTYPVFPDGTSLRTTDRKRWDDMSASMLRQLAGPNTGACLFSHPSLAEVSDAIIPITTSFHITAAQYYELEDAQWDRMYPDLIPLDESFVLYVDGNEWFPALGDGRYKFRTDLFFADFNTQGALVIERSSWTGPGIQDIDVKVYGADFDRLAGTLRWRISTSATHGNQRTMIQPDEREKRRMFRVALGFSLLLRHPQIAKAPIKSALFECKHYRLSIPEHLNIDRMILDVIESYEEAS